MAWVHTSGGCEVARRVQGHAKSNVCVKCERSAATSRARRARRNDGPRARDTTNRSDATSGVGLPMTERGIAARPKQSLGQNFLVDPNMIRQITAAFVDAVEQAEEVCQDGDSKQSTGRNVVEIGPGFAALSQLLVRRFPEMLGLEIDQRAVAHLNEFLPEFNVVRQDVLETDWKALASERAVGANSGKLYVIGNLPYNIISQILFSLIESCEAVDFAMLMMQLEVAQRVAAPKNSKAYGILSVMCQLYTEPKILFQVPPSVFRPKPDVTSAMVILKFRDKCNPRLDQVDPNHLRQVVRESFQQRRKQLRNSLRLTMSQVGVTELSERWASRRPQELDPEEFIDLTYDLFGPVSPDGDTNMTGVWRTKSNKERSRKEDAAPAL
ncbi:Ribosomal RNA small subunit methyltransferase A [Porphyridium purpureum]|uniref:rRNA adenine N(6)-methyltransferase n=1 Tax=Porphyridium purpureum TaxID=35688 RepID=A0A5J4YST1_PORPP|nr:Ribosomal RNA small subunit methyltransferase A [Porphyridium purpureum]|eukprot:POR9571..scf229_5